MRHDAFSKLVFELSKLPGIGEKTATRLGYYILKQPETYAMSLSDAIQTARTKIGMCESCMTLTDATICSICSDSSRDRSSICVVERPVDAGSIEKTTAHKGLYHILHGVLSPLDGIGPEELKIRELLTRIQSSTIPVKELILAINPSVEGEATAIYLSKLIRPLGVKITRLAHGIPIGGLLEYTDRETLMSALQNRLELV
ncbi:MAG: recombination mediator RecR [Xanthomonadaceae bacterium]|nr:recombination mediator RecR [Xanthomonadaceae bacterium]